MNSQTRTVEAIDDGENGDTTNGGEAPQGSNTSAGKDSTRDGGQVGGQTNGSKETVEDAAPTTKKGNKKGNNKREQALALAQQIPNTPSPLNPGKNCTMQYRDVKSWPSYLIIVLKRFTFNAQSSTTKKISKPLKFGTTLIIQDPSVSRRQGLNSASPVEATDKADSEAPATQSVGSLGAAAAPPVAQSLSPEAIAAEKEKHNEKIHGANRIKYNLSSFILHHGDTAESGHYICYSRSNADWWRYDDANVKHIDSIERELQIQDLAQSAYVFLYEREAPNCSLQIMP